MENWINKKLDKLSSDSKSLFNESLLCYSIKANRASLLFSYLAFLTIIKEIIISSKKPDEIGQTRWDQIIKELNNEDKWEKRVYDELVNSSSPIFNISESIRQQIKYWKDRRNDCAHFKENEINNTHVEIFWGFLKSNLSKITIEGGKLNLLKKIAIHFDETKTPPNADYKPLIKEIDNAIDITESESFFKELHQILDKSLWFEDRKISNIFYDLTIGIESIQIQNRLIRYIKSVSDFDLELIKYNPQIINAFNYSSQDIREIWKTRVYRNHGKLQYYIYSAFLRNGIIPSNQINEAMQHFFNNFNQEGFANIPNEDDLKRALANKELLEIIRKYFFEEESISSMKFEYINKNADLIELLIEYGELDLSIVKGIIKMYNNSINPWWLTNNLNSLFKRKSEIAIKFEEICNKHDMELPDTLK